MASITAAKSGPWSDPATWIGGRVPTGADTALTAAFIVTVDQNIDISTLTVSQAVGGLVVPSGAYTLRFATLVGPIATGGVVAIRITGGTHVIDTANLRAGTAANSVTVHVTNATLNVPRQVTGNTGVNARAILVSTGATVNIADAGSNINTLGNSPILCEAGVTNITLARSLFGNPITPAAVEALGDAVVNIETVQSLEGASSGAVLAVSSAGARVTVGRVVELITPVPGGLASAPLISSTNGGSVIVTGEIIQGAGLFPIASRLVIPKGSGAKVIIVDTDGQPLTLAEYVPVVPKVETGICVPDSTDWACAYTDEEIEALDPAVKARSEALAWTSLASLTGYQVATCPTMVRPCSEGCNTGSYTEFPLTGSGSFRPGINPQGFWVNSCGCGKGNSCSCTTLSQVELPGPVGGIIDVLVDGSSLDPSFYRVDQGHILTGQNGYVFPACQDMTSPETEEGTFAVRYWKGFAPNSLTNYAAGVLAAEFYKACTNNKACRLPNGVTSITRQGVTMEIQSGLWQGGWTGIREVDAIIATFNPNGMKSPTVFASPDGPGTRTPTWRW